VSVDTDHRLVLAQLERACASGLLTGTVLLQAERLLRRLQTGVRIVVIGPQGAGKSSLCALLLGVDLPQLSEGEPARLFVNGPAEAVQQRHATPVGEIVRIILPLDLLCHLQVMDVSGSKDPATHVARMRWAVGEADMVIWCARDFTARDADFWAEVPDALKDHSFLVLTAADLLAEVGTLKDRITGLQALAAEEFHSLFPTTSKAGCDSLRRHGRLSDTEAAASGIRALSEAIRKLAASGRQADLDGALLFLQRHGIDSLPPTEGAPEVMLPEPGRPGTYAKALDLLRARMQDLAEPSPEAIATEPAAFLDWCGTLSEELQEIAAEETSPCADFNLWREELYAAGDKLVLMSMENDLRSAADAASILVQIKRDLQARRSH
jgi:hypothetical protein